VAVWTVHSGSTATGGYFAGGYPFSAVVLAVYGRGRAGGGVAALVLAGFATRRFLLAGDQVLAAVNNGALLYLLGAGILAWGVEVLREAERQRLAVEAELSREREERRRSAERAETAAHLHDSVLQTLALLQRRSDDPAEVSALARRQERELREWLGGTVRPPGPARALREALEGAAAEVERDHRVAVEVVVVGDAPLDEGLAALVAASREALVNAGKHAGVDAVSLYAEADATAARVFVRDRGRGFDPAAAPADRRGLRESIVARLQRHGGAANIRSAPGSGTEVALSVPLAGPAGERPGGRPRT
jgi:signal transduction histidine kinase